MSNYNENEETSSCVDVKSMKYFFGEVLNPKEYFIPFNGKRILIWLSTTTIITLMFFLIIKLGGIEALQNYLSEEILLLYIIVYSIEPLKRFLAGTLSRFPKFEEKPLSALPSQYEWVPEMKISLEERQQQDLLEHLTGESVDTLKLRYKKNKKLMIMIPCYKTITKVGINRITEVIISAIKQVPPKNIYIVDNGPWEQAPDETKNVIYEIHTDINYQYFPYPGKTTALMKATVDVLAHHHELKYVLTFDNDVNIPDNYQFHEELYDNITKAIVYPVRASSSDGGKKNILTLWQDIDYVMAATNKSYLNHFGSICKPHGAVSCWELKTLYKILCRHNGEFRGEDWQLGILLRTQYTITGTLKFVFDGTCFFNTDVPQKYFAPDGRWPQQVRSWMVVPFLYPYKYVFKPFFSQWRTNTLGELITMKFEQAYELWSLFSSLLRYPLIALQATISKFWIALGVIYIVDLVLLIITNYSLLPQYLQNDFKTIITYPIYKQIDTMMQVFAFLRTIFIELPKNRKHTSIQKLIDNNTLPSFNTDYDYRVIERAELNMALQSLEQSNHVNTNSNSEFNRDIYMIEDHALTQESTRRNVNTVLRDFRQIPSMNRAIIIDI